MKCDGLNRAARIVLIASFQGWVKTIYAQTFPSARSPRKDSGTRQTGFGAGFPAFWYDAYLELYEVRGMDLQGSNSAIRRRLERLEENYLRFLKETYRDLRRKGDPFADRADLFKLSILGAEKRQGVSRKQRPQSQRQESIRLALEKQPARNRGEKIPVGEEEFLRRKLSRRFHKALSETIGKDSS